MKKTLRFLVPVVLINAIGIFAVTWQMDSSPFSFPTTGVGQAMNAPQARVNFYCVSINNGLVLLRYQLPYGIDNGVLKIFGLSGNLIASFKVNYGSTSVQWSSRKNKVTSGVYMAALRYGSKEEKIKFSILQ